MVGLYSLIKSNFSYALEDGGVTGMLNYLSTLIAPSARYALLLSSAAKSALCGAGLLTAENSTLVDKITTSAVSSEALLALARET